MADQLFSASTPLVPTMATARATTGLARSGPVLGGVAAGARDTLTRPWRHAQGPAGSARTGAARLGFAAGSAAAALALRGLSSARAGGRRLARRSRHVCRISETASPVAAHEKPKALFATVSSSAGTWTQAVAEITQELQAMNTTGGKWDFGIAFVSGYDRQDDAVVGATRLLDSNLGMDGAFLGVGTTGSIGRSSDGERQVHGGSTITVTAVQLPCSVDGTLGEGVQAARPFVCGKEELSEISQIALSMQDQLRSESNGAVRNSTPKAWRKWLGQQKDEPKGILLFADPATSSYVEKTVLGGLDLAFPNACKVGGVCTHLRPTGRLAASPGAGQPIQEVQGKIAGIVLPSSVAIHALVTRSGFAIGKKLEITKAAGNIITEINGELPQKALQDIRKKAAPLEEVLIGRTGFLLGVEAPKDAEAWESTSSRPKPAQRRELETEWLMRTFEVMPDGELYVRNHDFKNVPKKVGKQTKTIQLHIQDDYRSRDSSRLMLQRYAGARMMMDAVPTCIGALTFQCAASQPGADQMSAKEREAQLRTLMGMDDLKVAGAILRGEFGPTGLSLGGHDTTRTSRHSHTVTTCVLCYSPHAVEKATSPSKSVAAAHEIIEEMRR